MPWFNEFKDEIFYDHRQIMEERQRRRGESWRFDQAVQSVRRFYRDRISGFAACGSVGPAERDALLRLVDALGGMDFPSL